MEYEVYTFGGGEYLYDIFSGVAALTTGNSYMNIIKISAMFGITWALLQSAFTNNFKQSITWFVSFMLMYNVLFVPKATVLIHDPLNKGNLYEAVPNVPFALAAFASYSSTIGKEITESMEAAFTPVDYLPYHQHGMLFGSKLITLSTSMKITDEEFASSINSFIKQCVFYDLLLHRYSLDELRNSEDIWDFLTAENKASQARSFMLTENHEQKIMTCKEGSEQLKGRWEAQIHKGAGIFGKLLFSGKDSETAKKLMMSYLPSSYSPLLGISKNATDLIKQNMLINAFDRAGSDFSNTGAGTNIYMAIRSNLQTKAAFSASKRQAEEWVPMLRIVFEVLFYGAFPLIFLLFLLPIGAQVAKGYFITFIWLQSWAPLYAILNRVMIGYAGVKASALGGYGLTIATQGGIEEINQSVALMAGYLSWSIPFIAAGITKGVTAISGLSASMLAVPQSAANSAAAEASTGNISLGNMNMGNASYNNASGNKLNDSAFFDSARVQAVNFAGGMTSMNQDGRAIYDQTGSVSRLPNMQLTSNDTQAQSAMLNASVSESIGNNFSKQASFAKSKSMEQLASSMAIHSINENHGVRFAEHTSTEVREAYNRLEQEANELARNNGIDRTTAFNMALNGSFGAGSGGGKGLGLGLSMSGSSDSKSNEGFTESERIYKTNQRINDLAVVSSAIKDRSLELSDSHGNSLNETFSQHYSEAHRLEEQSRAYFDTAKSYSEQAQHVSSQSLSFSQDRIPEFIEYAKSQLNTYGAPVGERALTLLAENPAFRENTMKNFIRDRGLNESHSAFKNSQASLGVNNLNIQYHNAVSSIEGLGLQPDSTETHNHFVQATEGKHIDNSILRTSSGEKIAANTNIIQSTPFDGAGVESSVKERLQDGAVTSQINYVQEAFDPSFHQQNSNFKKEGK